MEIIDIVVYSLLGVLLVILAIGLAVANSAGQNMINNYREYEKHIVDFTNPMQFSQFVSQSEFNGKIRCDVCEGFLTDHYHRNTITLSQETLKTNSISSMSVVAHELGHAMQYRDTPDKMRKFNKKRTRSALLGKFTMPIFIVGAVCILWNVVAAIVIMGIALALFIFGLSTQISTIKVEKEASQNALILLEKYAYLDERQIKLAKKVLDSAKLTYIAAFLKSVLSWTMLVNKYDFY